MASSSGTKAPPRAGQGIAPATWAAIATLAGTVLLLYTGFRTGEWRGVAVSELQILVVGSVTWFVLRER